MKNNSFVAGLTLIASLALAACSGGHGSLPSLGKGSANSNLPYTGPAPLASFSWGQSYLSDAQYIGPIHTGSLGMQVQVHMQNEQGLYQYAQQVSDTHSAIYRHFLTPDEIATRFGASASDYAKAALYFTQYGLHAGGWPQREQLFVSGPISGFERAFNTTFGLYAKNGQTFVAPVGSQPHLSTLEPVDSVVGLVHAHPQRSYLARLPNSDFSGYTPAQVQRAFDFTGAYAKYNGSGIDVAIVGTGPIMPQDLLTLQSLTGAPAATVTQVDVTDAGVTSALGGEPLPTPEPSGSPVPAYANSSGFSTPPPATDPGGAGCLNAPSDLTQCNPEDDEAQLDTQAIATLAPGSSVLFYLGYNANDCVFTTPTYGAPCPPGQGYQAEGINEADAETQQIIADDTADVVSMSFGGGEPFNEGTYFNAEGQGFGPVEYATLVSEGIAIFVSSGDTGAFECSQYASQLGLTQFVSTPCSSYPASDPSVVSVGGVNVPLDDAGRLTGQITAWGDQTTSGGDGSFLNNVGSGGGLSVIFPAPAWQAGNASVASLLGGMRGQPDISMLADPRTGPLEVLDAAFPDAYQTFPTGGTSLAAPQMAAMWALVLQACKSDSVCAAKGSGPHPYRLGNPAPLLYAIYGNASQYGTTMYDVLYGANGATAPNPAPSATPMPGYEANVGYDLVTGVGVPFAGHLINTVLTDEGGTNPNLP